MKERPRTALRARRAAASGRTPRRTPGGVRVRLATAADLAVLVVHRRRMWEAIGGRTARELDRADPRYRRWMARERRAHRFVAFLAEDAGGRVLGSGAVWLQPAQPRPGRLSRESMPYVLSMFTEPEARGRGVATAIVHAMIAFVTRRGYRRIFLHASDAGRPVYARLGFVPGNEMRLELPARRRPR